ncbi:MAG: RrF2 family transcriptional regulator [Bacillota bacterium]
MKISARGEYACRAILDLALHYNQPEPIQMSEIAQRQDIPHKYLEQILIFLKRAGLVESKRGAAGGYILTRPPGEISLGQVVRATDGPPVSVTCLDEGKECDRKRFCCFSPVWREVDNAVASVINGVNFEELCQRFRRLGANMFYI